MVRYEIRRWNSGMIVGSYKNKKTAEKKAEKLSKKLSKKQKGSGYGFSVWRKWRK